MNMSRKKQNAATAQSSNTSKASVPVSSDQAMLTVSVRARGSVVFTVTVKAVPVVVTAISDVTGLAGRKMRDISLPGAFKDPDGDDWWVGLSGRDVGPRHRLGLAFGGQPHIDRMTVAVATLVAREFGNR